MNYASYIRLFNEILSSDKPPAPYDDADYFNYVKLNESRQNRWNKRGELSAESKETISQITEKQDWIIISEPWCGDAAHNVAFIVKMAELNPLISLDIQLRDSEPFLIDHYLTNGGKSIPKLIVRDSSGNDLFTWGPRAKKAQDLYESMKEQNLDFEQQKIGLQQWYNEDQGKSAQAEIAGLLTEVLKGEKV